MVKHNFVYRVEDATGEPSPYGASREGPFSVLNLGGLRKFWRIYNRQDSTDPRPGPRAIPEFRALPWERYKFGCYSLPNLRHWFPRSVIKHIEREAPGAFVVAIYRAPIVAKGGRQILFDHTRAKRLAEFPITELHQKGA